MCSGGARRKAEFPPKRKPKTLAQGVGGTCRRHISVGMNGIGAALDVGTSATAQRRRPR